MRSITAAWMARTASSPDLPAAALRANSSTSKVRCVRPTSASAVMVSSPCRALVAGAHHHERAPARSRPGGALGSGISAGERSDVDPHHLLVALHLHRRGRHVVGVDRHPRALRSGDRVGRPVVGHARHLEVEGARRPARARRPPAGMGEEVLLLHRVAHADAGHAHRVLVQALRLEDRAVGLQRPEQQHLRALAAAAPRPPGPPRPGRGPSPGCGCDPPSSRRRRPGWRRRRPPARSSPPAWRLGRRRPSAPRGRRWRTRPAPPCRCGSAPPSAGA